MNEVIRSAELPGGVIVRLVLGDITAEEVDAIVNAANTHLRHGGGVAGAIVRRGGDVIQQESDALAPVPVGGAVATGAGSLPASHVIHAVGPRWGEGNEEKKLASAVGNSLRLAGRMGLSSISLPAISTGIFGFPLDRAAVLLLAEIRRVISGGEAPSLREVRLCLFDRKTLSAFEAAWGEVEV